MSLRVFPIAGPTTYTNDFGAGRGHQGNDLFAAKGTPVVAVDSGEVRMGTDVLGGNIANLYADDGTRYYYAHLSAFAGSRRRVSVGEVIGYVGDTGNAQGTSPHLHFEVHPGNGAAVNPYPLLVNAPRTTAGGIAERLVRAALVVSVAGAALYMFSPRTFRKLLT